MKTNGFWCNCSTFHPPVKPQKHHHPQLTSINHPFSSLLWKQSESCLEAKTIRPALSQILLLSGLDPLKASPVFDASPHQTHTQTLTPAVPQSSHGDVGWLSLLASCPAVWDVLPALQSAGKLWQAYLPQCSLTWRNRENYFTASLRDLFKCCNPHKKIVHFREFVALRTRFVWREVLVIGRWTELEWGINPKISLDFITKLHILNCIHL